MNQTNQLRRNLSDLYKEVYGRRPDAEYYNWMDASGPIDLLEEYERLTKRLSNV